MNGERYEEKHKKIVLLLVSKNPDPAVWSLGFAQVSSGSGVGKEKEFYAQVSGVPRNVSLLIPV